LTPVARGLGAVIASARRLPGRARRTVPAPLAALLGAVVLVGVTWALIVPPFQSPDEIAHFAYAQSLAERFALPGRRGYPLASSDQTLAGNYSFGNSEPFNAAVVKPGGWSPGAGAAYEAADRHQHPSRSDGGGPNPASTYPPLFYFYTDLAYWADHGGNAFDRLYAMRIWGVGLLLATVLGAWLLAGEVLGRRRLAQLACAAVTGLLPMETFISTSVNPDALMVPLWTFTLWLGARVIRRRACGRDTVALCAVLAAAILTKGTSYALVPAVLLALALGVLRHAPAERPAVAKRVAASLVVLAAPVLGWIGLTRGLSRPALTAPPSGGQPASLRQFISYVWQFYLPRLPFMTALRESTQLPLYKVWIRDGWGVFGWLEVSMPSWIYAVLTAVTAAIVIPVVGLLARVRDRVALGLTAFVALAVLGLLALLHVTDYLNIQATGSSLLQGRYLLPLVAVLGLGVGFLVTRLPPRWRAPISGAVLAGMLLLQIIALASVAKVYYA
jgi:4-amino-4-deoxy-L-arabinose transferase-like glycosyltransferase